jgi:hypothetical protein
MDAMNQKLQPVSSRLTDDMSDMIPASSIGSVSLDNTRLNWMSSIKCCKPVSPRITDDICDMTLALSIGSVSLDETRQNWMI